MSSSKKENRTPPKRIVKSQVRDVIRSLNSVDGFSHNLGKTTGGGRKRSDGGATDENIRYALSHSFNPPLFLPRDSYPASILRFEK